MYWKYYNKEVIPTKVKKGYCIYLRKSRADIEAENKGEDETLARHQKILLDLSQKLSLTITDIYKEVVSGETIASRPVMQHLLSEVEKGIWSGVLVVEVERLARGDTIDQGIVAQSFKLSNTKIITPVKTYDPCNEFDEEYFEFGLFMSRREYKTINRRLQRGRVESIKEGKYVGNTPPYGYKRIKLTNGKGYTLEIVQNQAEVIKLIYELYAIGELKNNSYAKLGASMIARRLDELAIKPMHNDSWSSSTIRGILRNPVYIGKIRWNSRPKVKKMINGKLIMSRPRAKEEDWILVDGLHKPIIDKELFNLVAKRLRNNTTIPIQTTATIQNPLSGLIVCGKCGHKMVRRPYNNGYPDCLICTTRNCDNVSSQLHLVEEKLLEAINNWLINYKIKLAENKHPNTSLEQRIITKNIGALTKEIQTLQKQLDSLHDLLEQGIYTIDKFLQRSNYLNDKLQDLSIKQSELENSLATNQTNLEQKTKLIPKIEKILQIYKSLNSPSDKNELLKEVISSVIYTKEVSGRWHAKPDDFTLDINPIIPE